MAALLVALGVMAIMMSMALPVWRHDAQREKEEELVFRGLQYVRAVRLYNAKTRSFPPSVDALVQGHYLRKKYKDPITNDDFDLVSAANPNPQGVSGTAQPGGRGPQSTVGAAPSSGGGLSNSGSSAFGGTVVGGLIGVRSKSKDESIRLYQNRSHYNEWTFLYVGGPAGGAPGVNGPGRGVPGGPLGPGGQGGPGGRGRQGFPGQGGPGGQGPFGPGGGAGRGGPGGGAPPTFPGRGRGGL